MNLRKAKRKKLPHREKVTMGILDNINTCWSIDFMSSSTDRGNRYRTFNVIDDYNREALTIEIESNICTQRGIRILENIENWRGIPKYIRSDNGPEFRSNRFNEWVKHKGIEILYIQPGKPMQNSLIERFNGTYRREVLNLYQFNNL